MDMVNFAAQVCGMAQPDRDFVEMPVRKLDITARDTKGMVQYTFTNSEGLELDCWLEYEPAERQTHLEPGCSKSIDLVYALHKGEDISEVLSEDVIGLIEEEALADMKARDEDDRTEAAIARFESRKEEA